MVQPQDQILQFLEALSEERRKKQKKAKTPAEAAADTEMVRPDEDTMEDRSTSDSDVY